MFAAVLGPRRFRRSGLDRLDRLDRLVELRFKAAMRLRGSQPPRAKPGWARLKLLTFIGVRVARLAASASQQLHGVIRIHPLQGSKIAALASAWPLA